MTVSSVGEDGAGAAGARLRRGITLPGAVIDRANRARWLKDGQLTLWERAAREVEQLMSGYTPSRLPEDTKAELTRLMQREGRRHGMERLPVREG
jgi:trimethylamine:corrinoid methyltransferase-like protein